MTEEAKIAYLAGFIDGEGCIRVMCNRAPLKIGQNPVHRLLIAVTQRWDHREPLLLLQSTFGGWVGKTKTYGTNRPCGSWQIVGIPAYKVLLAVEPYVLVKKAQVKAALAFHTWKEVMQMARKTGERLPDYEVEAYDKFMQLFSVLNGNKPAVQ